MAACHIFKEGPQFKQRKEKDNMARQQIMGMGIQQAEFIIHHLIRDDKRGGQVRYRLRRVGHNLDFHFIRRMPILNSWIPLEDRMGEMASSELGQKFSKLGKGA